MTTVLQVNTSARSDGSISKRLADELVARMVEASPDTHLVIRDLSRQPHPALDESTLAALFTPAGQRSPEQAARVALDDALIAEVKAAETVVIAAPMYNFGVSTQLKNWIDAIARARETFRYTERGPEGLLIGKKVYVVLTRGGRHRGSPADTQVPYLRTVLGFLGMTDIDFIYAEGLSMGPDAEREGIESARAEIEAVLA